MEKYSNQKQQIKKYLKKQYTDTKKEVPLNKKTKTLLSIYNLANGFDLSSKLKPVEQSESISKFHINPDEYHFTDIHGDIFLLINHINESGIATLNKEKPVLLFKIQDSKKIEIPFSEENLYNSEVIITPNFEINLNFIEENKKFLFHGDLFNRGNQSIECFITMLNLIEQYNQVQSKIKNPNSCLKWITGNHDLDFILTQLIYKREKERPYTKNELEFIKNKLIELNKTDNYVFCYYTPESDIISSHTVFIEGQVANFLEILASNLFNSTNPYRFFTEEEQKDIKVIREKVKSANEKEKRIEKIMDLDSYYCSAEDPRTFEIKLEPKEIEKLCHILNVIFSKIITEAKTQFAETKILKTLSEKIFSPILVDEGLMCYKVSKSECIDIISKTIIGHNDNQEGIFFLNKEKVLCLDIGASCGFNSPKGIYETENIFSKLLFVKNGQCFLAIFSEEELFKTVLNSEKVNNDFTTPIILTPVVTILLPLQVEEKVTNTLEKSLIRTQEGKGQFL